MILSLGHSSHLLKGGVKPQVISRPASKLGSQKSLVNFPLPSKFWYPPKTKEQIEKEETAVRPEPKMKEFVQKAKPVAQIFEKKAVAKKPKRDRAKEVFMATGQLRKFVIPEQIDESYYQPDIPDPSPKRVEQDAHAPLLFRRDLESGEFCNKLVFNDYHTYNTLHHNLVKRLAQLMFKWETDQIATSIIWESSCRNLTAGVDYQSTFGSEEAIEFLEARFKLSYYIGTMRKPFVPIMSGLCLGNAASFPLLANFSCATDSSMFSIPEPSFGYIPDAGVPFALTRAGIRGFAEFMATSGYTLRGEDLHHSRLARYFILDETIPGMELELSAQPSHKLERIFNSINSIHEPLEKSRFSLRRHLGMIGPCFDKTTIQDVFNALENCQNSVFAHEILQKMKKSCPLSLAVAHRLVRQALVLNLEDSLKREFIVAQNFMRTRDYQEGIKSKIEGREPVWTHKSVHDITSAELDAIFTPNYLTREITLENASLVPLNGPVFKYLQASSLPLPWDTLGLLQSERHDPHHHERMYIRNQLVSDRIYHRLFPQEVQKYREEQKAAENKTKEEEYVPSDELIQEVKDSGLSLLDAIDAERKLDKEAAEANRSPYYYDPSESQEVFRPVDPNRQAFATKKVKVSREEKMKVKNYNKNVKIFDTYPHNHPYVADFYAGKATSPTYTEQLPEEDFY